jgi:hypothetical protein
VLKKDVPWAMEFLSDILLKSNYDSNAVNAERGTILREMDEVNKDMREVIFDNLHATAYHGQPLGNTILGPVDNINSIVRDDLTNFVRANYTAARMNAIVVGDVPHAAAAELANKHFGSVSAQPQAPVTPRSKANYIGSDIRERNDDVTDIHFAIGFESFGAKSADSVALMVMQTLLGEWNASSSVGSCSSSELCRTVAEHGLAQQVSAFSTQYSDTGLFGVYGVGHKDHITDLIWATQVRVLVNAPCRCIAVPNPAPCSAASLISPTPFRMKTFCVLAPCSRPAFSPAPKAPMPLAKRSAGSSLASAATCLSLRCSRALTKLMPTPSGAWLVKSSTTGITYVRRMAPLAFPAQTQCPTTPGCAGATTCSDINHPPHHTHP